MVSVLLAKHTTTRTYLEKHVLKMNVIQLSSYSSQESVRLVKIILILTTQVRLASLINVKIRDKNYLRMEHVKIVGDMLILTRQARNAFLTIVIQVSISQLKEFAQHVIHIHIKARLERHARLITVVFFNFYKKMDSVVTAKNIVIKIQQERNVSPIAVMKDKRQFLMELALHAKIIPIQTKKQGGSVLLKLVIQLIFLESMVFAQHVIHTHIKALLERHVRLITVVFFNFYKKMDSVVTAKNIPIKIQQERNVSPIAVTKGKR